MDAATTRGLQESPLPSEATVLRGCRLPPDYPDRPLSREAFNFQLSGADKLQPVPKLSVYVQGLTTEAQVCALVGNGATYRLIALLGVADVRAVGGLVGQPLDVVWDEAVLTDGSPDTRPGAEGHAGIVGLHRPPGVSREVFKTIQVRLADAVGTNYTIVDAPPVQAG